MKVRTIVLGLVLAASACKDPQPTPEAERAQPAPPLPATPAAPKKPAAPVVVDSVKEEGEVTWVVLTSTDTMTFGSKEIRVKAGQTVKLSLHHTGKLSRDVMGHNFILLAAGTDKGAFVAAAAKAQATGYIPEEMKASVLAHTRVLGGGESDEIEFKAPAAGAYDFLCSFPGHASLMHGVFIVE